MKRSVILYFLLTISLTAAAQKQTFDLTSYIEPKNWTKEQNEQFVSYTLINDKTRNWCKLVIYRSTESKGSVEKDFESEWKDLVLKQYDVKDTPQLYTPPAYEGWDVKAGAGTFTFNNATSMAMLIAMTGYGKTTSIVALTNSQEYINTIDSFLSSVELRKPGESASTSMKATSIGIVGIWQKKSSAHLNYIDPPTYVRYRN